MKFGYFDWEGSSPAIVLGDKAATLDASGSWRIGGASLMLGAPEREVPKVSRERLAELYPKVDLSVGEALLAKSLESGDEMKEPPETSSTPPTAKPSYKNADKAPKYSEPMLLAMERAMRTVGQRYENQGCLEAADNLRKLRLEQSDKKSREAADDRGHHAGLPDGDDRADHARVPALEGAARSNPVAHDARAGGAVLMTGRQHIAAVCYVLGWHMLLLTSLAYLLDPAPPLVFASLLGFGAGLAWLGHWLGLPPR